MDDHREELEAKEAGITLPESEPEPVPEDRISTALYDLDDQQIDDILALESSILEMEEDLLDVASKSGDQDAMKHAMNTVETCEETREKLDKEKTELASKAC